MNAALLRAFRDQRWDRQSSQKLFCVDHHPDETKKSTMAPPTRLSSTMHHNGGESERKAQRPSKPETETNPRMNHE